MFLAPLIDVKENPLYEEVFIQIVVRKLSWFGRMSCLVLLYLCMLLALLVSVCSIPLFYSFFGGF